MDASPCHVDRTVFRSEQKKKTPRWRLEESEKVGTEKSDLSWNLIGGTYPRIDGSSCIDFLCEGAREAGWQKSVHGGATGQRLKLKLHTQIQSSQVAIFWVNPIMK